PPGRRRRDELDVGFAPLGRVARSRRVCANLSSRPGENRREWGDPNPAAGGPVGRVAHPELRPVLCLRPVGQSGARHAVHLWINNQLPWQQRRLSRPEVLAAGCRRRGGAKSRKKETAVFAVERFLSRCGVRLSSCIPPCTRTYQAERAW